MLQEVNSGTEKIICNPIYLQDLFREDCLKPFKDEDEDNDDVVERREDEESQNNNDFNLKELQDLYEEEKTSNLFELEIHNSNKSNIDSDGLRKPDVLDEK